MDVPFRWHIFFLVRYMHILQRILNSPTGQFSKFHPARDSPEDQEGKTRHIKSGITQPLSGILINLLKCKSELHVRSSFEIIRFHEAVQFEETILFFLLLIPIRLNYTDCRGRRRVRIEYIAETLKSEL